MTAETPAPDPIDPAEIDSPENHAPAELVPAIAGLRAAADVLDGAGYGKTIGAAVAQVYRIATVVERYMNRVVAYDTTLARDGGEAADALRAEWAREDAAAKGSES